MNNCQPNSIHKIVRGAKKVLLTTATGDFRLGIANQCGIVHTANLSKEPVADALIRDEGFQVDIEAAGAQGGVTDLTGGNSKLKYTVYNKLLLI